MRHSLMRHYLQLTYAGIAYLLAMVNITYLLGFIASVGVPKGINPVPHTENFEVNQDLWTAVIMNVLLVLGFGLHHSITARPWFKRWWTQFVPPHLERATYLYMTAIVSVILVVAWQPIPITLWKFEAPLAVAIVFALFFLTWGIMFAATFHFGHFSFFGLAQAWAKFKNQTLAKGNFSARYLYGLIRHPISMGWMLTPWLVPHFTVGQLVFALSAIAYVLSATWFEERDLISEFGERYRQYQKNVPAFLPKNILKTIYSLSTSLLQNVLETLSTRKKSTK